MQLIDIDKTLYRRRFNRLLVAIIVAMFGLALGISQSLIAIFPRVDGNHFAHNLSGAITAALIVASLLHRFRDHPAMYEIVYVWRLKQELNRIYRKQRQLLAAVDNGDVDAMTVMNYSYQGSRQLYELDDNKITFEELDKSERELQQKAQARGVELKQEDYRRSLLERF